MIIIVCYSSRSYIYMLFTNTFFNIFIIFDFDYLFWSMVRPIVATSSVNPNPTVEESFVMMESSEHYVNSVRQIHDQSRLVCPTDQEVHSSSHLSPSLLEVFLFLVFNVFVWWSGLALLHLFDEQRHLLNQDLVKFWAHHNSIGISFQYC